MAIELVRNAPPISTPALKRNRPTCGISGGLNVIHLRCQDCRRYAIGEPVHYPNTPPEKDTWRDCKVGCRIKADTVACHNFC